MGIFKKETLKKMKYIFLTLFVLGIIALIYAHYEYTQIKIKTLEIASKDIPEEFDGKTIIFAADFQLDTYARFNKKQSDRIINLINEQEKDLIILGGDYTNWTGKIPRFYKEMEKLKKPEYGIYAVLGNHDYNSAPKNIENLKRLGYKVLINENDKITINNRSIYISAVDDLLKGKPDAEKTLEGIKKEDFNIYITHNPDYFEDMTEEQKNRSDITLAGHTHGGQITLFGLILLAEIKHPWKYGYGLKEYDGHKIYTTSGVGGSAFELFIRFFAQSEIVVLKLKKIN
ncbi:metallophosphoesterase [Pseudoleptotrichia goodfellowii]|uniref:Ser/Thr phosphatase family protein n=1 Tax=Pseudoleptotrichia goodfellowii F0264 TaxID=596323 RepID=D0GNC4_9FUSO|nr:Ser/Thr phosphatase family protein [Pseudoleptotrichia goodfellowii F0264]